MPDDSGAWRPRCAPPRDLVRPVRLDPDGRTGPTRGKSRGPGWRQTSYGYYVPSGVDPTVPEQRVMEQSVRLPSDGAVTGWAACRLAGAAYFDGLEPDGLTPRPVPMAVGRHTGLRGDDQVVISRERLAPEEVRTVRGIACTTTLRGLFDEMREVADVREAAVAMDMMAAAELASVRRMRRYVEGRSGWRHVQRVRDALELADEDSRSPNETRMRLVWVLDAGLPRPLVNQPVFDLRGDLLGVADLFDSEAGVVGEFDGAAHRWAGRHRRDVLREDRFRRAGLEYFKVVGLDLADVDLVVDRMLATRARALRAPRGERDWTLEAPPGWYTSPVELMTLDERMEYQAALRGLAQPG